MIALGHDAHDMFLGMTPFAPVYDSAGVLLGYDFLRQREMTPGERIWSGIFGGLAVASPLLGMFDDIAETVGHYAKRLKNASDPLDDAAVPAVQLARGAPNGAVARTLASAKRTTGTTVLGHNPGYIHLADDIGARRFHIPDHIRARMSVDEVWAANQKFLDRTILRGDDILLSTRADLIRPKTFLARELDYLINVRKAYRLSDDGMCLIKLGN